MANKNTRAHRGAKEPEVTAYIAEIGRLQAQVGELSGEVGRLRGELMARRGVRPAIHALYRAIDTAITLRIERRGHLRKPPRRAVVTPIPEAVLRSRDPVALKKAAERYDAAAYFRLHTSNTGMRFRYRIASAVYATARDASVATLKGIYRTIQRRAK